MRRLLSYPGTFFALARSQACPRHKSLPTRFAPKLLSRRKSNKKPTRRQPCKNTGQRKMPFATEPSGLELCAKHATRRRRFVLLFQLILRKKNSDLRYQQSGIPETAADQIADGGGSWRCADGRPNHGIGTHLALAIPRGAACASTNSAIGASRSCKRKVRARSGLNSATFDSTCSNYADRWASSNLGALWTMRVHDRHDVELFSLRSRISRTATRPICVAFACRQPEHNAPSTGCGRKWRANTHGHE